MSALQRKQEAVACEITGLADLDRATLASRWKGLYGRPPPYKLSRQLMEKALAYEIQSKALGGMKASTRRALRSVLTGDKVPAPYRSVAPGTRLIREWNGRTYEIEVIEGGFVWQSQTWRSLSRIAREITGSNWSGPRFFGLHKAKS